MPAQPTHRFKEKFEEQIRFIERSCDAYDEGHEDEALRIATALRVLFHDTSVSVSLATHVNLTPKSMLSSARVHGDWKDFLSTELNLSSATPIRARPILGYQFHKLTLQRWWRTEPVFLHLGSSFGRSRIVLAAANKDGGAHVDAKLENFYQSLCEGEFSVGITGSLEFASTPPFPQGVTMFPGNSHLALIRQFAHEFLRSVAYFKWK